MRATRALVTTSRVVYTLPSPCYWADIEAVFWAIRNTLASQDLYDDTVTIEAFDDELRISYDASLGGQS